MRCLRAAPRSRARLAAALVVVVGSLGFRIGTARADASFALSWRSKAGGPACVTEEAIRAAVERKLERNPFTDLASADIVIGGEEERVGAHFRARVTQRDRNGVVLGSRDLDAPSCSNLMRMTAVVVALFIEPGGEREAGREQSASESSAERDAGPVHQEMHAEARVPEGARVYEDARRPEPPEPATVQAPVSPAQRARIVRSVPRPFQLSLGLGGTTAIGLLPEASAGLHLLARLDRKRSPWSFEWSAGYAFPQSVRHGSVRGMFSAVEQQLRACVSPNAESKLKLDACGGVLWAAIVPGTTGTDDSTRAWRPLAGPIGALALQLGEGRGAARLDLGLAVPPLRRAPYYVRPEGKPERFYTTGQVIVFVGVSGLFAIL